MHVKNAKKLGQDTLEFFDSLGVNIPKYNRSQLRRMWVHFGPSHFFAAHQAAYINELNKILSASDRPGIGITVISLRSEEVTSILKKQHGLYTLVEQGAKGTTYTIIGSIVEALHRFSEAERMWEILSSPKTQIVSLTVTQKGYYMDSNPPHRIRTQEQQVKNDLDRPNDPVTPAGVLVEALWRRFNANVPPFTVLSCDNIPKNGSLLRSCVRELAHLQRRSEAFMKYLMTCSFPDSMVDRIAPHSTNELIEQCRMVGIEDARPVPTEAGWSQWVIEDKFCSPRPLLDLVGVEYMDDTRIAELIKLRMLNGAHMALGVVGSLAGFTYVHEAMSDATMRAFISNFHSEMMTSLFPHAPELDMRNYVIRLHERLSNPHIKDRLLRLTNDITKKLDVRFLSPIRDILSQKKGDVSNVRFIVLAIAAWMAFVGGKKWQLCDPEAEELRALAEEGDPCGFLQTKWFGRQLVQDALFVEELSKAHELILERGMKDTLNIYRKTYGRRCQLGGVRMEIEKVRAGLAASETHVTVPKNRVLTERVNRDNVPKYSKPSA